MKKGLIVLLGISLLSGAAQAAGVNKILRGTVNETLLQGYAATPPTGWARNFHYSAASPASDAVQKIAVISSQIRTAPGSNLPTPIGLTTLSTAGAILTKDTLPAPMQLTAANCAIPSNCTGPVSVSVRPDQAIPARLIVTTVRFSSTVTFPPVTTIKIVTYAFDPAAALGSADRWTLIDTLTTSTLTPSTNWFGNVSGGGLPIQKLFLFSRLTATSTRVFEVVNK